MSLLRTLRTVVQFYQMEKKWKVGSIMWARTLLNDGIENKVFIAVDTGNLRGGFRLRRTVLERTN